MYGRLYTYCELSVQDAITQHEWHTGPDSVCQESARTSVGYTAPDSQYVKSVGSVCTPTLQNQSDTLLPEIETTGTNSCSLVLQKPAETDLEIELNWIDLYHFSYRKSDFN